LIRGQSVCSWLRYQSVDHPNSRVLNDRLLSIDELDRGIVNLAAGINAATYELLVLVRQFDERAGWLKWGLGNCAE